MCIWFSLCCLISPISVIIIATLRSELLYLVIFYRNSLLSSVSEDSVVPDRGLLTSPPTMLFVFAFFAIKKKKKMHRLRRD